MAQHALPAALAAPPNKPAPNAPTGTLIGQSCVPLALPADQGPFWGGLTLAKDAAAALTLALKAGLEALIMPAGMGKAGSTGIFRPKNGGGGWPWRFGAFKKSGHFGSLAPNVKAALVPATGTAGAKNFTRLARTAITLAGVTGHLVECML